MSLVKEGDYSGFVRCFLFCSNDERHLEISLRFQSQPQLSV